MRFIKVSTIRQRAKDNGKRCPKSWLLALDMKVEALVNSECRNLGSKKTLSADDSNLRWNLGSM